MKILLTAIVVSLVVLYWSFVSFSEEFTLFPKYDDPQSIILRNFRTAELKKEAPSNLNLEGLSLLRISGSGQFSEESFEPLIRSIPLLDQKKLIVLDLRQESHGFINHEPIHWSDGKDNCANIHKDPYAIELDEFNRLHQAIQTKQIIIAPSFDYITVESVKTERALVESYGATYFRLPVVDHLSPTDETVDRFVELVQNLSSDQWVHMHCKAGKGRTTTFLTLFDIMHNARHVALDDILSRQHLIGGSRLAYTEKKNSERTRGAIERLELIQNFYLYCRQVPSFDISWSEWIQKQKSKKT